MIKKKKTMENLVWKWNWGWEKTFCSLFSLAGDDSLCQTGRGRPWTWLYELEKKKKKLDLIVFIPSSDFFALLQHTLRFFQNKKKMIIHPIMTKVFHHSVFSIENKYIYFFSSSIIFLCFSMLTCLTRSHPLNTSNHHWRI